MKFLRFLKKETFYYLDRIPQPFLRNYKPDSEDYMRMRTLFWFAVIFNVAFVFFAGLAVYWNSSIIVFLFGAASIFFFAFLPAIWYIKKSIVELYIMTVCISFLTTLTFFQGGIKSPPAVWLFTVMPTACFGMLESKKAKTISAILLLTIIIIYAFDNLGYLPPNAVPEEHLLFYYVAAWVGGGLLIFSFLGLTEYERKKSKRIIEQAHEDVLSLKKQQDGDYFLTTLIVNPLFKEKNEIENIKINSFCKQKKQFHFKNKNLDLGGDINIVGNIQLYGQKYLFFVNADAMGKSMQGASGSIVFATIINSLLMRYSPGKNFKINPHSWLEIVYNELQKIFSAFDGSMFISCFMGILNSSNGKLYYFNAEHPSAVLYRDKIASFVDEEPLKKIGFPNSGNESRLPQREFQLQPEDVIILGSDGRDDINLNKDQAQRDINSDEKLFLTIVEKTEANLNGIYESLQNLGEIIDDLSLLKIEFLHTLEDQEKFKIDYENIKKLINNSLYERALEELESVFLAEEDSEYIFLRSFCMEKVGLGTASRSLLELNFEKIKNHKPAIQLMSYLYYKAGNFTKAMEVINAAFIEDNATLKRIKEKILNKMKSSDQSAVN